MMIWRRQGSQPSAAVVIFAAVAATMIGETNSFASMPLSTQGKKPFARTSLKVAAADGNNPASDIPNKTIEPEICDPNWRSRVSGTESSNNLREKAILVECEWKLRTDDGSDYDRNCDLFAKATAQGRHQQSSFDAVPSVFCGYKMTPEEYNRLRSANLDC
jgi:hypothetical protein